MMNGKNFIIRQFVSLFICSVILFVTVVATTCISHSIESNIDDISQGDAVLSNYVYEFNGDVVLPDVTVTYEDKILENGVDYYVTYFNNKEIGTAYAVITGINGYVGTLNVYYALIDPDFSFVVEFDLNGGILEQGDLIQQVRNNEYIEVPKFHKDGHTFKGFNCEISEINTDTKITAIWEANKYTVKIDLSDVLGFESNYNINLDDLESNVEYDDDYIIPEINYPGKVLIGYTDGNSIYTNAVTGVSTDMILTPVFTETKFKVNYNSIVDLSNYDLFDDFSYLEKINLEDISYDGYEFLGYYYNGEKITELPTYIPSDLEVEIRFEPITYNIKYEYDVDVINYNTITKYTILDDNIYLNDLVLEGYVFDGWYFEGNKVTYIDTSMCKDITLVGKMYQNVYKINYTNTLSANNPNPNTYNYDSELVLMDLSKAGYHFNGWYLDGQPIDKISSDNYGNITLEARWELLEFSITYIMNGGTNNPNNPTKYTVEDEDIILLEPTKDDYSFFTWLSDSGVVHYIDTSLAKDITLEAQFELCFSVISYANLRGAENPVENSNLLYAGQTIKLYPLTLDGYIFDGWNLNNEIVDEITYVKQEKIILYAMWTPITYNINYELLGGINDVNNASTYTIEDGSIKLYEPVLKGHAFGGWKYNDTIINELDASIVKDVTLTAVWNPISYLITYDFAGGTQTGEYKSSYTVLDDFFELGSVYKYGFDFKGWTLDGSVITIFDTSICKDVTLIASFEESTYTIKLDPRYTDVSSEYVVEYDDIIYTMNSTSIDLPNPVFGGHIFLGWYEDDTLVDSDYIINSKKNYELEARWGYRTYNVEYYVAYDDGEILLDDLIKDNNLPSKISLDTSLADAAGKNYIFNDPNVDYYNLDSVVFMNGDLSFEQEINSSNKLIINEYWLWYFDTNDIFNIKLTYNFKAIEYTVRFDLYTSNNEYGWFVEESLESNTKVRYREYKCTHFDTLDFPVIDDDVLLEAGYEFKRWESGGESLASYTSLTDFGDDELYEINDDVISIVSNCRLENVDICLYVDNTLTYYYRHHIDPLETQFSLADKVDAPIKENMDFLYWDNIGETYTGEDPNIYHDQIFVDYNDRNSVHLMAVFEPKTYYVNYSSNIECDFSAYPSSYKHGETLELIDPVVYGYYFNGWYLGEQLVTEFTFVDDIELTAKFSKKKTGIVAIRNGYTKAVEELLTKYVDEPMGLEVSPMDGYVYRYYDIYNNPVDPNDLMPLKASHYAIYKYAEYIGGMGFLSYIDEFNVTNSTIYINSEAELIAYYDYIAYTQTYLNTNSVILEYIDYDSSLLASDIYNDYLIPAFRKMEFAVGMFNLALPTINAADEIYYLNVCASSEQENQNTLTYSTNVTCTPVDTLNSKDKRSSRSKNNTTFKYSEVMSYIPNVNVSTSSQLEYIMLHGGYPIIEADSKAQIVYDRAVEILNSINSDELDDYYKLLNIFTYLADFITYDYDVYNASKNDELTPTWARYDSFFLEGALLNGLAVCDGIAKAFALLARIEGIAAVKCVSSSHAWNKVYYDGKWYVCDLTHAMNTLTTNILKYEFTTYKQFMISDDIKHNEFGNQEITYTNIVATGYIDYYTYNTFVYDGVTYDYVIDSFEELEIIIRYLIPFRTSTNNCGFVFDSTYYVNGGVGNHGLLYSDIGTIVDKMLEEDPDLVLSTSASYYDNQVDGLKFAHFKGLSA